MMSPLRKDELVQALQQISVEDRKQQLKNSDGELESLESRIKARLPDGYSKIFRLYLHLALR